MTLIDHLSNLESFKSITESANLSLDTLFGRHCNLKICVTTWLMADINRIGIYM